MNRFTWKPGDVIITKAENKVENGGPGSGNFGHGGRPGQRGGSSSKGSGSTRYSAKTKKSNKTIDSYYKKYPALKESIRELVDQRNDWLAKEEIAANTPEGTDEWVDVFLDSQVAKEKLKTSVNRTLSKMGASTSNILALQDDWSNGNGPRDEKTGRYIATPPLETSMNDKDVSALRAITHAVLVESGQSKVKLYRGERQETSPKGLTSFTTSRAVAGTFGKVTTKTVDVTKIISHHEILLQSQYKSEAEVIVDLG